MSDGEKLTPAQKRSRDIRNKLLGLGAEKPPLKYVNEHVPEHVPEDVPADVHEHVHEHVHVHVPGRRKQEKFEDLHERKSFWVDKKLLERLLAISVWKGDQTEHINRALSQYLDRLEKTTGKQ